MSQSWAWPRIELSNGAVEAMKWLGLILMTADHAQKYGLLPAMPGVYEAGRLAFPLFGMAVALFILGGFTSHNRQEARCYCGSPEQPASRWFYCYYPAHLAVFLLLGFSIPTHS